MFSTTCDRRFDAFGVPAIAKAENALIIRHEIDLEVAEPHAANDLVFGRFHEPLLTQLVLQLSPLRMSNEINDEIHVIGCPNPFEHDLISNEKGCCATADKHEPLAQFVSQRLRDRFQHVKQLAFDGGHFLRSLCDRRSAASPASL